VDLVRAALALEGRPQPAPTCLLAAHTDAYEFPAELASAVRPLPLPSGDLDPLLKSARSIELLSAWGRYGSGDSALALASFTTHAPARDALALIVTDRGIALRGPSGSHVAPHDELELERAVDQLAGASASDRIVFVAAEASVPVSAVHGVLAALGARGLPAALAVNLASDTKLPLPASANAHAQRCEDGLPPTDAADGNLEASELTNGLAALKEQLPDCLARGDARGAAGGRLTLAFRINQSGRVQESCVTRDDIGDPGVAACVNGLARTLRFAPPAPTGVLDIELPLALRPTSSKTQPPSCSR
jgi:hypothetical protein